MKCISAFYPIVPSSGRIFIDDTHILIKQRGIAKQADYNNLQQICIQPIRYYYFIKRYDCQLLLHNGDKIYLYNITSSGVTVFINTIKQINPSIHIIKSQFQFGTLINGIFAVPNSCQHNQLSSKLAYAILAMVIIVFIIFLYKAVSLF